MKIVIDTKPKYFIFGYLIALVTLPILGWIALIILAAYDTSAYPSNWTPFFTFYRSYECMGKLGVNCITTGERARTSNDNILKTLNNFKLYYVEFPNKNKVDFSKWQCREFLTKRLVTMSELAPKGASYECWPNDPIPQELFLNRFIF